MHKVGENETNDDYSYEDNSNYVQNDHEITTRIPRNPSSNGFSYSGKFNPYSNLNSNTYSNYNNWSGSTNIDGMGIQRDYSYQYPGHINNFDGTRTSSFKNQAAQDRACLVHCMFHELKMVITK